MSKTRIYEVARNLDRTSKEILAISNTLGFEAKAANSSMTALATDKCSY